MTSYFEFAGRRSDEFGLVIEYVPHHTAAKRRVETVEIPGRNGLLLHDTGTYEHVTQTYEVWFHADRLPPAEAARQLKLWLLQGTGYQTLRDSYDPEVFRRAVFTGPMDLEILFRRYVRFELEFDCMPQRFLDAGAFPVQVQNGGILLNRYMPALPKLVVTGSGAGTVTVGEYAVGISDIPPGGITIDSDIQDAYSGMTNANGLISVPSGFPRLEGGANKIQWTGGVTAVQITPRWWTL